MQPVRKTKTFRGTNSLTARSFYGQGIGDWNHKNLSISTGLLGVLRRTADDSDRGPQIGAGHARSISSVGGGSEDGDG